MSEEIKIQYLDPFGHMNVDEAEQLALAMRGKWFQLPTRWLTREELEKEYGTNDLGQNKS